MKHLFFACVHPYVLWTVWLKIKSTDHSYYKSKKKKNIVKFYRGRTSQKVRDSFCSSIRGFLFDKNDSSESLLSVFAVSEDEILLTYVELPTEGH